VDDLVRRMLELAWQQKIDSGLIAHLDFPTPVIDSDLGGEE